MNTAFQYSLLPRAASRVSNDFTLLLLLVPLMLHSFCQNMIKYVRQDSCMRTCMWTSWWCFDLRSTYVNPITLELKVNQLNKNISTTVHAMTKSFVLLRSVQDGESIDINYLVFWAYCKNGEFWWNSKSIIRDFHQFWVFFIIWNIDTIRTYSWFWVKWRN